MFLKTDFFPCKMAYKISSSRICQKSFSKGVFNVLRGSGLTEIAAISGYLHLFCISQVVFISIAKWLKLDRLWA